MNNYPPGFNPQDPPPAMGVYRPFTQGMPEGSPSTHQGHTYLTGLPPLSNMAPYASAHGQFHAPMHPSSTFILPHGPELRPQGPEGPPPLQTSTTNSDPSLTSTPRYGETTNQQLPVGPSLSQPPNGSEGVQSSTGESLPAPRPSRKRARGPDDSETSLDTLSDTEQDSQTGYVKLTSHEKLQLIKRCTALHFFSQDNRGRGLADRTQQDAVTSKKEKILTWFNSQFRTGETRPALFKERLEKEVRKAVKHGELLRTKLFQEERITSGDDTGVYTPLDFASYYLYADKKVSEALGKIVDQQKRDRLAATFDEISAVTVKKERRETLQYTLELIAELVETGEIAFEIIDGLAQRVGVPLPKNVMKFKTIPERTDAIMRRTEDLKARIKSKLDTLESLKEKKKKIKAEERRLTIALQTARTSFLQAASGLGGVFEGLSGVAGELSSLTEDILSVEGTDHEEARRRSRQYTQQEAGDEQQYDRSLQDEGAEAVEQGSGSEYDEPPEYQYTGPSD